MKIHSCPLVFWSLGFFGFPAGAADRAPPTDAVSATREVLTQPEKREKAIQESPKAKDADDRMKRIGLTGKKREKAYKISADLMETLAKDAQGDPEKMQKKVEEYLANPASLEKDLTPEQKKEIHDLSNELELNQGPTQNPR